MKINKINITLFLIVIYMGAFLNSIHFSTTVDATQYKNSNIVWSQKSFLEGELFVKIEDFFADNFVLRDDFLHISGIIDELKGFTIGEKVEIVAFNGLNVAEEFEVSYNDVTKMSEIQIQSERIESFNETHKTKQNISPEICDDKVEKKIKQDETIEISIESKRELVSNSDNKLSEKSEKVENLNEKANQIPPYNLEEEIALEKKVKLNEGLNHTSWGQIMIIDNIAAEINVFNSEAGINYANAINNIKNQLGNDIIVYSLLVPTQVEFLKNKKYRELSYPQVESIKFVNEHFNDEIISINVYDNIKKHKDEYIYFRTDHHWTQLGAYYAYEAFINQIGDNPLPINDFTVDIVENFLGSLYNVVLSDTLKATPDTIEMYIPQTLNKYYIIQDGEAIYRGSELSKAYCYEENKYGVFLGGDTALSRIDTTVTNGKKILVIKDSYANAFIPFLAAHYEHVYIIDPRQYNDNVIDFVKEYNINEVMFLNYALITRYDGYAPLFNKISQSK